jgi:hypothetical protein
MLSPQMIYYLILYLFIFLIHFFKVYPYVRDNVSQYNWWHYGFFSLEIVYTSAGVALLVMGSQKDWMSVMLASYMVLLVCSAFLDTIGTKFKDKSRFTAHMVIIGIVILSTIVLHATVVGKVYEREKEWKVMASKLKTAPSPPLYRVGIPYVDLTLDRYLGRNKLEAIKFVFITKVSAPSREEAIEKAKAKFWGSDPDSMKLFSQDKKKSLYNVSVFMDEAFAERLGPKLSFSSLLSDIGEIK